MTTTFVFESLLPNAASIAEDQQLVDKTCNDQNQRFDDVDR